MVDFTYEVSINLTLAGTHLVGDEILVKRSVDAQLFLPGRSNPTTVRTPYMLKIYTFLFPADLISDRFR